MGVRVGVRVGGRVRVRVRVMERVSVRRFHMIVNSSPRSRAARSNWWE